ncbi:SRPBCC domain-containing protein [Kitasatospora sp. NPDC006697]|uniref:SRPBCC family protein n=1 Tax=Kitasatospora sp. NPDC006697 TaxID=3364020 RepID=UPI0036BFE184
MTHPFEIELREELPASPEEVWAAIATGPGIDSWFMGRNEVEPREGGAAALTTGGHREEALITGYEPGKRFATRTQTGEDGRFMAFEYLIEGREQGSTVLRAVHSGFLGDDWQDEYDALRRGWPFYLNNLREYLRHFPGRTAAPVFAFAPPGERSGPESAAVLAGALSLAVPVAVGTPVRARPNGLAPLDGEVIWADVERFGVRSADGLYTFHHGTGAGPVLLFHHLFDSPDTEAAWQQWLTGLFS